MARSKQCARRVVKSPAQIRQEKKRAKQQARRLALERREAEKEARRFALQERRSQEQAQHTAQKQQQKRALESPVQHAQKRQRRVARAVQRSGGRRGPTFLEGLDDRMLRLIERDRASKSPGDKTLDQELERIGQFLNHMEVYGDRVEADTDDESDDWDGDENGSTPWKTKMHAYRDDLFSVWDAEFQELYDAYHNEKEVDVDECLCRVRKLMAHLLRFASDYMPSKEVVTLLALDILLPWDRLTNDTKLTDRQPIADVKPRHLLRLGGWVWDVNEVVGMVRANEGMNRNTYDPTYREMLGLKEQTMAPPLWRDEMERRMLIDHPSGLARDLEVITDTMVCALAAFSEDLAQFWLRDCGSILSSRGAPFWKRLNEVLTEEEWALWFSDETQQHMSDIEMPSIRAIGEALHEKITLLKSTCLNNMREWYQALSEEDKAHLHMIAGETYPPTEHNSSRILDCINGKECVMVTGWYLVVGYNEWCEARGQTDDLLSLDTGIETKQAPGYQPQLYRPDVLRHVTMSGQHATAAGFTEPSLLQVPIVTAAH